MSTTDYNRFAATMAALANCIDWNQFTPEELQRIQADAQARDGDLGFYLQDFLKNTRWWDELGKLSKLGYDPNLIRKRIHPELDESEPVTDFIDYKLTPLLEFGSSYPLHIYYRDWEESSAPEIRSSCIGLQTLISLKDKIIPETRSARYVDHLYALLLSKGDGNSNNPSSYRLFAPKSACIPRRGGPRLMPAYVFGKNEIEWINFSTILTPNDFVLRRNCNV